MIPALGLAFLSGFIALSYEILWYRAYSFMSAGAAPGFGFLLGAYLAGLAAGAWASRSFCRSDAPAVVSYALGRFVLLANFLGYLLIPGVAWLLTLYGVAWTWTLPLVAVVACGLGTIFPLVSHWAVPPDARVGARVSYIYFANIVGSTAGSLLTGFWLADVWPLRSISLFLAILGAVIGALVLLRHARGLWAAGATLALAFALNGPLYDGVYERMQCKFDYRPGFRFLHVVENRSGVITVSPDGTFFGGGWYDGAVNTGLDHDRNGISRVYAVPGLHPHPRDVLTIGLSTGSWALVLAENPQVERLTIVEINKAYLDVIPLFPEVAGVLTHPKVRIEIDDARRWLVRNRDRKFDLIIYNTTVPWRAHTSNLVSEEFLDLARAHLREGGIVCYNTCNADRVVKTALARFPYGLKFGAQVAVSDSPIRFDGARWQEVMASYPRQGKPAMPDPTRRALMAAHLAVQIESREAVLTRLAAVAPITDDNMGIEWTDYPIRR